MTNTFHANGYVVWKWASSVGRGSVSDAVHDKVEIESKGKSHCSSGFAVQSCGYDY